MLRPHSVFLIFVATAFTAWAAHAFKQEWEASEERCQAATFLIREAQEVLRLAAEAEADPFIEFHAMPALVEPTIAKYRDAVAPLLADTWNFHLRREDLTPFSRLLLSGDVRNSLEALREIAESPAKCPIPARTRGLASVTSFKDWSASNQAFLERSRARWKRDQNTFCKTEKTHAALALAKRTMEERCAQAKKKKCQPKQVMEFSAELDEVQARLDLNREKIQKKWGEKLAGRVLCSLP